MTAVAPVGSRTLLGIAMADARPLVRDLAVALVVLVVVGVIAPVRVAEAYAVIALVLFVNWLRVLGAHRYESTRERLTFPEQVLDSVDHTAFWPVAELWAPLGLRHHAVHHLFPGLPYHALPEARRRLLRALPPDAGYRRTEARRLTTTIGHLLLRARPAAGAASTDGQ